MTIAVATIFAHAFVWATLIVCVTGIILKMLS